MSDKGASDNERLLAAARQDNEELILEILEHGTFDINYKDGLGNTALHYAAMQGSTDVLEHILSHDQCDVDPINRLDGATPLHVALQIQDAGIRTQVVESLVDAGADASIKDKHGDTPIDLLRPNDEDLRTLLRKSLAQASVSRNDIVNDDDDDEPGSGSGSDEE